MRGPFTIPGELLPCSFGFSSLSGTGGHLSFLMRIHAGDGGMRRAENAGVIGNVHRAFPGLFHFRH
jgi:hypothetical protein